MATGNTATRASLYDYIANNWKAFLIAGMLLDCILGLGYRKLEFILVGDNEVTILDAYSLLLWPFTGLLFREACRRGLKPEIGFIWYSVGTLIGNTVIDLFVLNVQLRYPQYLVIGLLLAAASYVIGIIELQRKLAEENSKEAEGIWDAAKTGPQEAILLDTGKMRAIKPHSFLNSRQFLLNMTAVGTIFIALKVRIWQLLVVAYPMADVLAIEWANWMQEISEKYEILKNHITVRDIIIGWLAFVPTAIVYGILVGTTEGLIFPGYVSHVASGIFAPFVTLLLYGKTELRPVQVGLTVILGVPAVLFIHMAY